MPVTKEATFLNRNRMVLKNTTEVSEALGANEEKRVAQVIACITNDSKKNEPR